jgi:hypothetical protein
MRIRRWLMLMGLVLGMVVTGSSGMAAAQSGQPPANWPVGATSTSLTSNFYAWRQDGSGNCTSTWGHGSTCGNPQTGYDLAFQLFGTVTPTVGIAAPIAFNQLNAATENSPLVFSFNVNFGASWAVAADDFPITGTETITGVRAYGAGLTPGQLNLSTVQVCFYGNGGGALPNGLPSSTTADACYLNISPTAIASSGGLIEPTAYYFTAALPPLTPMVYTTVTPNDRRWVSVQVVNNSSLEWNWYMANYPWNISVFLPLVKR